MTDQHDRAGAVNRRQMLSIGAAGLAAGLSRFGSQTDAKAADTKELPVVDVASLSEFTPGHEVYFEYPDENSPAIALRLSERAEGGVGPDESIVAFSSLCTHKGCPVNWNADQQMLICPCHWSTFDPAKKARLIIGQASSSLPQITLRIDGGMVRAVGVDGLIYGRQTNIL